MFLATPLAYAETHYCLRVIPNILRKPEPEIILDVPHRVEPGRPIPILLLVKDADRYPIRLLELEVLVQVTGQPAFRERFDLNGAAVDQPWYWRVVEVQVPEGQSGLAHILPRVRVFVGGRERHFDADNYRKTSHEPFLCYIASAPLPYPDGWYAGDLHTHSHLTSDQVEFGVPWEPGVALARAMGLSWYGIADHSYDLDDHLDDALRNHEDLPKWHLLWREVDALESRLDDFVLLPGEELSVGNRFRRNVHMLIFGERRFFEGHGDSAERWFRTKPQWRIPEVLERVSPDALVAAAHPGAPVPPLEWLLLRRGRWGERDLQHPRLDGMQCLNGSFDSGFERALTLWIRQLLRGNRLALLAGNDAHGNFGRFRQIGLPFVTMRESREQLFGRAKTVVHLPDGLSRTQLLAHLRNGRAVITDGPFLEIRALSRDGHEAGPGEELADRPARLYLRALSTQEFGYVREINIWLGRIGREERRLERIRRTSLAYEFETEIPFPAGAGPGYVRATLFTRERGDHHALTNPVWFG